MDPEPAENPETVAPPLSPKEQLKSSGENLQFFGWIALAVGIVGGVVAQVNGSVFALIFCAIGSLGIFLHIIAQLILIRAALEK